MDINELRTLFKAEVAQRREEGCDASAFESLPIEAFSESTLHCLYADLDALDGAGYADPRRLQIGLEPALGVLHHVHTDPALLLRQTAPRNVSAGRAMLAAHVTLLCHDSGPRKGSEF